MNPRERDIEQQTVRVVEAFGGRCLKWTAPGWRGVPDRICLMPNGRTIFIELKAPCGRVGPLQQWWADELKRLGHLHFFIRSGDDVDRLRQVLTEWRAEGWA